MFLMQYTPRDTGVDLSSSGANQKLAQRFQLKHAAPIGRISLSLKRVGSPVGYLQAVIYSDSSGDPGSAVTNGTSNPVHVSSVGTGFGCVNFDFDLSARPQCNASTSYHVGLQSSGYTYSDGTTEIIWGADQTDPYYPDGEGETYDGADWSNIATATDFIFRLYTSTDRTDEGYSLIPQIELLTRHMTNSGVFDYSTTADVSATLLYDFSETVANTIDGWLAGAGFSTPVTNTSAIRLLRQSANYGVAMHIESTGRTAGFRGERGSDTHLGGFRTIYYDLKKDLEEGGALVDALLALGLTKTSAGQLGRGLSAGGIEQDDLDSWEDDDDLIRAKFRRGMWDND